MDTIWKFPLERTDNQLIKVTKGARILSAKMQHGVPCLWIQLDPKAPQEDMEIIIRGTNHPIDREMHLTFIDTLIDNQFVWHVFANI